MTEAIHFQGGGARGSQGAFFDLPEGDHAAVIELLRTLRVLPAGSGPVVLQRR